MHNLDCGADTFTTLTVKRHHKVGFLEKIHIGASNIFARLIIEYHFKKSENPANDEGIA